MAVDFVFGVIVLVACLRGFKQGFARQVIQLTGLTLGVCFAETVAAKATPHLESRLTAIPAPIHGPVLVLSSMFIIWMVISVSGSIYLAAYRKRIYGENVPSLGDSVFGVGIGLLKAAFIVSLVVFGFDQLPATIREIGPVDQQAKGSKGVQLSHDFKLVDRLIGTQEVQSIGKRMSELVNFLRQKDEITGKDEKATTSGTAPAPEPDPKTPRPLPKG